MSFLRESIDAMRALWASFGNAARAMIVVGTLILIAVIAGVGVWSSRPHYIQLADGLAPSETAEIVSRLQSKNIRYELNFSGSTVMVAKNEWNRARMLVDDVATFSSTSADFDSGMLGDPDMNRYKLLKHREDSLAATIRRISGISNASVHLAFAKSSPFQHERETTTASVVIEVRPGMPFTREQSSAIVELVAGSVEGLDRDGVSVMDTRGRVLSSPVGAADSSVAAHFEFRRRLETELSTKAATMLVQLLGQNRAVVRVSADLDFTQLQRTETKYDPDLKVRSKEEISNISTVEQVRKVGGVAGADANLGGSVQRTSYDDGPVKHSEETNTTSYENAKTVDTVKEAPGKIKRLTIAVMADLSSDKTETEATDGDAEEATPATPPEAEVTKANIEAIVKQAVGFDASRGDEIEVLVSQFRNMPEDEPVAQGIPWDTINTILRNSSLGLASVVALIMGLLTLKKMKPITIPTEPNSSTADRGELLASLSDRIRNNPETMQAIIASWLNEDNQDSDQRDAA